MNTRRDPRQTSLRPPNLIKEWRRKGLHRDVSLGDALAEGGHRHGGTRMVFSSRERPTVTTTIAGIVESGTTTARRWAGLGVGPGSVVAIQAPNWEETAVSYTAVALLGAVLLPIVPIYGPAEVGFILRQSRARMFVAPPTHRGAHLGDKLAQAGPLPDLEHVIVLGDAGPAGALTWDELDGLPLADLPDRSGGGDDLAVVVYTSGTTGDPKGVCHTADSLLAELHHNPTPPRRDGVVSLQPFPAGHTAGLSALLGPVVHGVDTILMDHWSPDAAAELITSHRVTAMAGTPFHILGLLDLIGGRADGETITEVITGGAGVPASLVEDADSVGWKVSRCYGATELPSATWSPATEPLARRALTDGRPMGGNEVRIVDPRGVEVGTGVEGEVLLRGPEQFAGYVDSALDAEVAAGDGWFRTGDIGAVDRDGYLTITDRLKDVIIRGGENISSVEVESVIRRHPAVDDAAVVPSLDRLYGERVCAFVVLRPGASLSLDDLRRHFDEAGVARQKAPERLEVVAALPRTAVGKVRKSALREQLAIEAG